MTNSEDKANFRKWFDRYSIFVFVFGCATIIAQLVCLLAVINPGSWLSWAFIARWVYATHRLIFLGIYAIMVIGSRTIGPTRFTLIRGAIDAVISLSIISFLFLGQFRIALLVSIGWGAFSAVRTWLFPQPEELTSKKSAFSPPGTASVQRPLSVAVLGPIMCGIGISFCSFGTSPVLDRDVEPSLSHQLVKEWSHIGPVGTKIELRRLSRLETVFGSTSKSSETRRLWLDKIQ